MSFYRKGTTKHPYEITIDYYMEGIRIVKNGKMEKKEKLPEKTNKYNLEYLMQAKELIQNFKGLMATENMYMDFIKRYAQKETNILRNIYRIIVAQKKTANYMEKLAFCLKKYMLYDKNIINAIDKEISMTHERYERNKKLITEWTIDFGLESLVEQIQSDYSTDIFGHAALIHEKFTLENDKSAYADMETFFKAKNTYYTDAMITYAQNKGIDIEHAIKNAIQKDNIRLNEVKKRIQQEKRNDREKQRKHLAEKITTQENANIYHALETANEFAQIGIPSYKSILSNLKALGGEGYYVNVVKSSKLQYVNKDKRLYPSIYRAAWFGTDTDSQKQMSDFITELTAQYPDAEIIPQKMALPANILRPTISGNRRKTTIDNLMEQHRQSLMNILMYGSTMKRDMCFYLENQLLTNNGTIYYINAIAYDTVWHTMMLQYNNPGMKQNGISDCITDNMMCTKIFREMDEAKQYMETCMDTFMEKGWTLAVNKLEFKEPYVMHETNVKNAVTKTMDKTVELMNTDTPDIQNSKCSTFRTPQKQEALCKVTKENKSIRIILRRSKIKNAWPYFIKCVGNDQKNGIMDSLEKADMDDLVKRMRASQFIDNPIYAPQDDIQACHMLEQFMQALQEKYVDNYVFTMVQLTYENGLYTWSFV